MIWLLVGLVLIGFAYDWVTTLWLTNWLSGNHILGGDHASPPNPEPIPTGELALREAQAAHLVQPAAGPAPQQNRRAACAPQIPAITYFRPLKTGVPQLEVKLRAFFSVIDHDDQVLIGIHEDDLASASQAQAALAVFSEQDIQIVFCRRDVARNPKINKLLQLAPLARHEHWIVADSELENPAEFLPEFVNEWTAGQFPVLSAPYRFRHLTLATAPVLHMLLPGLAVLQRTGKITNTLGAALAVTRAHIAQLGGWESLSDELAEDYQLGHRLAAQGVPVRFSRTVAALDNDPATVLSTFHQLHRISATYRRCQPLGFAGSLVLHSIFWSLLAASLHPIGWAALALASVSRVIVCQRRAQLLGWSIPFPKILFLIPVSSLLDTVFWCLAWLPLPIHWAGRRW
ncbi:MAG TPA: glycosyltransferase [Chthoniobacterales bacterium]|jgi:ceramide glucosyltransferase